VHLGSERTRRPGLKTRLLVAGALVTIAVLSLSCGLGGLLDTFHVETVQYTCESPDIPSAFDGVRIVFVSDIHRGPYYSETQVGRLVDKVNALDADLILLGGDYVYTGTKYESSSFSQLSRLKAPLGCFAILGNHDYGRPDSANPGSSLSIKAAAEAGIPLLLNEGVWLERGGQRIRLGGVADYAASTSKLGPVVEGTKSGDFVLLLSHNPDFSEDLPKDKVDLVLSGHTHGGQVTFFGIWAPYVPSNYGQKYRSGIVQNAVTWVIVSNGIGVSTPLPIRIYAPAQIVVVTLRTAPVASVHP
jgi:predicted MPP superfamily phosphohydrolase